MLIARRQTTILALTAFVPLIVLGLFEFAAALAQRQQDAERQTLERASTLGAKIDSKIMSDLGALDVLSSSQFIRSGDWAGAQSRAHDVAATRPTWKNVILTDAASGEMVFETARANGRETRASEVIRSFLGLRELTAIGGTSGIAAGCKCVILHHRLTVGRNDYDLSVLRDVADLQALILSSRADGEVAALFDRSGLFIARSLDVERRWGTPGTRYVQEAVARRGVGVYDGTTWEGLKNRTAYVTSSVTGWSTHIAVPSTSHDVLDAGSIGFEFLAFVLSLFFAAGLTWYGAREIRARRAQERAHVQSQKLEAIGHLSGTLAHDFNNLLAIMTASIRLLEKSTDEFKRAELVREGLAAADRGAELIKQLLAFAREKPIELARVDLDKTIRGILGLIVRSVGPAVRVEIDIDPSARFVTTNAPQLEMALLNLAVNARDAMPNGGLFAITTKPSAIANCVDLIVKDTGTGMSEAVAARALEPYFTTKAEGEGTGLGLAQVHLLVRESEGGIMVDTAPGKGTSFILRLPTNEAIRPVS